MKKAYSKPKIFFDSFELSQSIAVGCSAVTNTAQYICSVDVGNGLFKFFNDEANGCEDFPQPGTQQPCYEVPVGGWNVFGS